MKSQTKPSLIELQEKLQAIEKKLQQLKPQASRSNQQRTQIKTPPSITKLQQLKQRHQRLQQELHNKHKKNNFKKRLTITSLVILLLLGTVGIMYTFTHPNQATSITGSVVGSFESYQTLSNAVTNPSFETALGSEWTYSETTSTFNGARLISNFYTATQGSYVYLLGSDTSDGAGALLSTADGDYSQVRQTGVDFTGTTELLFDTRYEAYYGTASYFNISVLIDDVVVWSKLNTDYTANGISIDTTGYTGTHNLTFRFTSHFAGGIYEPAWWFDNIILNAGSTPPTQGLPILNSTDGTSTTAQNITIYNISTSSSSGNTVKNIINWYQNGVSILQLNMPFEGGSTNTISKDYSNFSYNGTVSDATWVQGGGYDRNGSYSFNGINSSIITLPEGGLRVYNPSFETAVGSEWTYSENNTGFENGRRLLTSGFYIPTNGNFTYILGSNTSDGNGVFISGTIGDYAQVRQTGVDLTGATQLLFDTRYEAYYGDSSYFNISVLIDNDIVWSRLNTDYINNATSINTSAYTGKHTLTFRLTNGFGGGIDQPAWWFDNIIISTPNYIFPNMGSHLSAEAWIRTNDTTKNHDIVGRFDNSSAITDSWMFLTNGTQLQFWLGGANGYSHKDTTNANLVNNTWYHVVAVYNGDQQTTDIFVNGINKSTTLTGNIPSSYNASIDNLTIGNRNGASTNLFAWNGSIDEVRVWNLSLSQNQINLLYANQTKTIASDALIAGQVWQGCITPNDGSFDGKENCSNSLNIKSVITQGIPILNSSNKANTTSYNLTIYNISTFDGSGYSIKNIITWYRNSTNLIQLNMPFEGGSNSTFTKDYSNFSFNGTVSGATWVAGGGYDRNGSYSFDGINDIINASPDIKGSIVNSVANPSFETAVGSEWTYSENNSEFENGRRLLTSGFYIPTNGNFPYILGSNTSDGSGIVLNSAVDGQYSQVRQTGVDFTGATSLLFDTRYEDYYGAASYFNISVLIDNDIVWSRTSVDYINNATSIDTTGYTGTHNLTFRLTDKYNGGIAQPAWWFDNLILLVTSNTIVNLGSHLSAEAWIRTNDTTKNHDIVGRFDNSSAITDSWMFLTNGTQLQFWLGGANGYSHKDTTNANLINNTWYHVVAVYDGDQQTTDIFVNGVNKTTTLSGTIPTTYNGTTDNLTIGNRNGASTNLFAWNGSIDEVRVWNLSLSQNQINLLYTNQTTVIASDSLITGQVWQSCVSPTDIFGDGITKCSNTHSILEPSAANVAPSVTGFSLSPNPGYENTTYTISTTYSDPESTAGTVYIQWIVNGSAVLNQTNTSVASGSSVSSTINGTYFNHFNVINVSAYGFDSDLNSTTVWSNQVSIWNFIPTMPPYLLTPNGTTLINLTPPLSWNNSADIDSDTLTYRILIDDNSAFNNPEVNNSLITQGTPNTTANTTTELTVDTTYYWRVQSFDGYNYSNESTTFNFTISSYLALSILQSTINFGTIERGQGANTSGTSISPFRIENVGNIISNLSVKGTNYFDAINATSSYYQFNVEPNETNAFNVSGSNTSWINVSALTALTHVLNWDYHSWKNDVIINLKVLVPNNETAGPKNSTVTFTLG